MPRAFTIVDLVASIAAVSALGAMAVAMNQPDSDAAARRKSQQAADVANIRGIGQAMIIWAQNHADMYPIPSDIDKSDATIAGGGRSKNTTANIMSLLIFNNSITPERLVSPLESNPNIVKCEGYEFKDPKKAAVPDKATFDPTFSAEFIGGKGGLSYAHLLAAGKRLPMWSNTFSSSEMVAGTRGPEIDGIERPQIGAIAPRFASPPQREGDKVSGTRTCEFYGSGSTFAGNYVYNDNSVRLLKPSVTHRESIGDIKDPFDFPTYMVDGNRRPDVPSFDEPDDTNETNMFLGIFIEAGASKKTTRRSGTSSSCSPWAILRGAGASPSR